MQAYLFFFCIPYFLNELSANPPFRQLVEIELRPKDISTFWFF